MLSSAARVRMMSARWACETGATRNPRWSSVVTSPSASSRDSPSRIGLQLTPNCALISSSRSFVPGFFLPLRISDRMRSLIAVASVTPECASAAAGSPARPAPDLAHGSPPGQSLLWVPSQYGRLPVRLQPQR